MSDDREERIRTRAHEIWEREGRPEGRAMANWLKAERILSDDAFLEHEKEVEVEEGGIVPKVDPAPSPFRPDPIK